MTFVQGQENYSLWDKGFRPVPGGLTLYIVLTYIQLMRAYRAFKEQIVSALPSVLSATPMTTGAVATALTEGKPDEGEYSAVCVALLLIAKSGSPYAVRSKVPEMSFGKLIHKFYWSLPA